MEGATIDSGTKSAVLAGLTGLLGEAADAAGAYAAAARSKCRRRHSSSRRHSPAVPSPRVAGGGGRQAAHPRSSRCGVQSC